MKRKIDPDVAWTMREAGASYRDIAERFGVTLGGVDTTLRREAHRRFRGAQREGSPAPAPAPAPRTPPPQPRPRSPSRHRRATFGPRGVVVDALIFYRHWFISQE